MPHRSWDLIHGAVHVAKELGQKISSGRSCRATSSTTPTRASTQRWSERGVLGVEMEAAALFTLAALRGVQAGCILTVSDIVVDGEFTRISDDELRAGVDRMTRIALATAVS